MVLVDCVERKQVQPWGVGVQDIHVFTIERVDTKVAELNQSFSRSLARSRGRWVIEEIHVARLDMALSGSDDVRAIISCTNVFRGSETPHACYSSRLKWGSLRHISPAL